MESLRAREGGRQPNGGIPNSCLTRAVCRPLRGRVHCLSMVPGAYVSSAMTSDTPKSAMTSVTDILLVSVSLAAQGAPRATGAVKETSGQCLSEPVVALVNDYLVHRNAEFLSSHIDGRDHIFVNHFGRHSELFTKDIQHRITTNETHQVVAAALRFGQRMFGSGGRFRKTDLRSSQSHLRRAPLQLGVAIPRVM